MGKAPEKVTGNVIKRYQRKTPAAESDASVVAVKQEDNQMEHRAAEPVAVSKAADVGKASKPRNPAAAGKKKKPKATVEIVVVASEPVEETEEMAVAIVATVTATATKKNMKKRQLAEKSESELLQQSAQVEEVVASVEKQKLSKNQHRKRKQQASAASGDAVASSQKKEHPSLLKQLLWKAKPVAPALSPSSASSASSASSSAPVDVAVVPAISEASAVASKSPQPRKQQRSADDADEDEEIAYTVSERQNRKRQASKRVQETKKSTAVADASATAVCLTGSEPSSQETQSGSDEDDAAAASILTAYENLVPSEAIQPKELSVALVLETALYPEPFPVALTADVGLLRQHGVTVHEVLIEDFAFHPPQLRIKNGDIVIWKVSSQTLGMVEHSLEASMVHRAIPKQKKFAVLKASTPPLGSGTSFAWRFEKSARINVECSVYQTKGVVLVGNVQAQSEKKAPVMQKAEVPKTEAVIETPAQSKTQLKRQKLAAKRLRVAEAARLAALAAQSEQIEARHVYLENDRDSIDAEPVFHPPQDLSRSADMDAGVCRAVLTQLEEVAAATQSTKSVIMIGDVECPVICNNQVDELESPTDVSFTSLTMRHPEDKPCTLDEWSGTEEEDEDDDVGPERDDKKQTDEMEDFQQRIIGMLQRSEQARADQRRSFQPDQSGFDAGTTYDFFKRRFTQVQMEDRKLVYSKCPEQPVTVGLTIADVLSVLAGASA